MKMTALLSRSQLACLLISVFFILYPFARSPSNIISWDVYGYYLYLPAFFIYHDGDFNDTGWMDATNAVYNNTPNYYQLTDIPGNKKLVRYSSGLATIFTPGFFIAHSLSEHYGYPADGFSWPYQLSMIVTHFLVVILSFWLLRKLLLNFFSDRLAAVVLLLIAFGTNYLITAGESPGMTHIYCFALQCGILLLTIRWHQQPKAITALFLGFLIGFITLVRPNNFAIILVPLFWNTTGLLSTKEKITSIFRSNPFHILLMLLGGVAGFFPQMLYWKKIAGEWLYYSYANPGEGFDWFYPHTLNVLFSFRKGWLIYTPLIVAVIGGIVLLRKKRKDIFLPVTVFFLVNLYIVSSWTCWWYAAGYSQRALVDCLPVLSLPLGFFLQWTANLKEVKKNLIFSVIAVLVVLNLFQSWQYATGIMDGSRMTAAAYGAIFGKTEPTPGLEKFLVVDHDANPSELMEDTVKYESSWLVYDVDSLPGGRPNNPDLFLDSTHDYAYVYYVPFREITRADHILLRISGSFYLPDSIPPKLSICTGIMHEGKMYCFRGTSADDKVDLKPGINTLVHDVITPHIRNAGDQVNIYFWLREPYPYPLRIKNVKIKLFEPRY